MWGEISKTWLITKFVDIDVEDLTSKVDAFYKMA